MKASRNPPEIQAQIQAKSLGRSGAERQARSRAEAQPSLEPSVLLPAVLWRATTLWGGAYRGALEGERCP